MSSLKEKTINIPPTRRVYQIAVFTACDSPLEELDLAFMNVKFIKFADLRQEVSGKLGEEAASELEVSIARWLSRWAPTHLRLLVPIDFNIDLQHNTYNRILQILLIAYPSDLRALSIVNFEDFGPKWCFLGEIETDIQPWRQKEMTHPLSFKSQHLPALKRLFERYFNVGVPKYLVNCIDSYISHFFEWKKSLAFLSLCICFEALADGKDQVTYRVRRNLSVINGTTTEMSDSIFGNVGLIYELRSKIVHGEDYEEQLLAEYLPYLKVLIASTILELIAQNIAERADLNSRINRVGFGEKTKLIEAYDPFYVNKYSLLTVEHLPKKAKAKQ